jgi:biopolymer transport protein ExbD
MRIRHVGKGQIEKVEIPMTPMIDIVFQLLVFFLFTLKIGGAEGDFGVKMPLAAPQQVLPAESQLPPMKIRMIAGPRGELSQLLLNDMNFGVNFDKLHSYIVGVVGDAVPGGEREQAEVELDCDYDLRYEYVIQAITAVSGRVDKDGHVIKLIDKLKFAPPKTPGE